MSFFPVSYTHLDVYKRQALYIGTDNKGKEKREFEIVNMLQAAQYYKTSNDKEVVDRHMVPIKSCLLYTSRCV